MIWTNGAGASTGMFVPALAVGATGGRMAGRIVKAIVRCACGPTDATLRLLIKRTLQPGKTQRRSTL